MRLAELFGNAGLDYPPELGDMEITKIVTDSRQAVKGCLFLCIRGLHTDGFGYVNDAINAGAGVIVAERVRDACVGGAAAWIMLENTRRAAALLYNAWYGNPCEHLKIIGVTGTNGKTSVCFLLTELLEAAGHCCGLLGTVRCRSAGGREIAFPNANGLANMTTPDPEQLYAMLAEMVKDGVEYAVMEVSSHALALEKVAPIFFDVAIFTNLTQDHLDFHGDMEAYFAAKKKLFERCRMAVINTDDGYGRRLWNEISCPALTCSVRQGDYCALEAEPRGFLGSVYLWRTPMGDFALQVGIPGGFSVFNSLMAASVAMEYGVPFDLIRRVLKETVGVEGRMERVRLHPIPDFSVLIDYAHTPDALEKLLKSVHGFRRRGERIVLLFGCGGDRDRGKRKAMANIASRFADEVIITSDNSRSEDPDAIIADILRGMDREKPYMVISDRRTAIETAVVCARSGDILILAGKGHERYEIGREGRVPFDERKIVREAFEKRLRASEKI
jgi:UDP-N-acetylmuramoyl-L-alanyl-D-glutamate--2,6-diaminopimelate ligase